MTTDTKLRAVALSVVMVFSVFAGSVAFAGTALGAGTDGNVSLSINAAGNQATVTVDDPDLDTAGNTPDSVVVNVNSTSENATSRADETSSDTEGGTEDVTISPGTFVHDRNGDGSINAADFTLLGASDESISSVSPNTVGAGSYTVTINDPGGSVDGNPETVSYTKLSYQSLNSDTDSSQQVTTNSPVGDRNLDGVIDKNDITFVTAAATESISNFNQNADGTATFDIVDSSDSDDAGESFTYLSAETAVLTETGQSTGTFTGTTSLQTGTDSPGVLNVSDGDTITATYWEDGTTGKTAQKTYSTSSLSASASASPTSAATGESISLDATSSTGSGLTYQWDTDGDSSTIEKTGSTPSVSYASSGVEQITLTVNDGQNSKTDTVTVAVGDSDSPSAKLDVYPRFVTKNKPAYLVAEKSSDDLQGGIKKYEWDVGADGSYEYSSTQAPFTQHTFTSSGDEDVTLRVTDYAGNTDTVTKTVTVKGTASTSSTSVQHTGNGTAPTGSINVKTRNEGGMLKLHLYRGSNTANRDLGAAGVDESTELWVNVTMSNYEPNAMMASAKVDEWLTENVAGGTKVAIKMHPINMQRLNNPGSKSPGRWPSQNKQADKAITPGAHLATFDMPDGTEFEKDFDGATLTSDAQQFSPPQYDSQSNQLTYTVAAPHWKASGNKVASNTNSGFYEAWIPSGLASNMGIQNPDELAGAYQSGGTSSDLADMDVSQTASGGLHINVTGIHYSSGTVQLSPDDTDPTADAGSDQTVTAGSSMSFDGSASSDNRKVETYEWDVDGDNTYDLTGEKPSHTYTSTGSKTVTLRVTDGNGNTATDTMTVTVESSGGGGSGGSTVTGTTATVEETGGSTSDQANGSTTVKIEQVSESDPTVTVSVDESTGEGLSVSEVSATFDTGTSTDNEMTVDAGDSPPAAVPEPAEEDKAVLGYVSVDVEGNLDDQVAEGSFLVHLDSTDLENTDPDDIIAKHYHDGEWQTVETERVDASTVKVITPDYSAFAITTEQRDTTTPTATPTPTLTQTTTPAQSTQTPAPAETLTPTPEQSTETPVGTDAVESPTATATATQTPGAAGPGFGVLVALLALVVTLARLRRTR